MLKRNNDGKTALDLAYKSRTENCIERLGPITALEISKKEIQGLKEMEKSMVKDQKQLRMEKLQILQKELECPICLDPFEEPHIVPECCHRFCLKCIEKSIKQSSSGKVCPMCRSRISSKRILRKDELIGNIAKVVRETEDMEAKTKDASLDDQKILIGRLEKEKEEMNLKMKELKIALQKEQTTNTKFQQISKAQERVIDGQKVSIGKMQLEIQHYKQLEKSTKKNIDDQNEIIKSLRLEKQEVCKEVEKIKSVHLHKLSTTEKENEKLQEEILTQSEAIKEKEDINLALQEVITSKESENDTLKQEIKRLKCQIPSSHKRSRDEKDSGYHNTHSITSKKRSKTTDSVASSSYASHASFLESENDNLIKELKKEKKSHVKTLARLENTRKALKEAYAHEYSEDKKVSSDGPSSHGNNRSNIDRRTGGSGGGRWNNRFSSSNNRGYDDQRNHNIHGNYYHRHHKSNQNRVPRTRDQQHQESPFQPLAADDENKKVSSVEPLSPEQQEHRKKQKLLKVTAENWDSCTFEDKARSQFLMDHNAIFTMEGLTADEDTRYAKTLAEDWFAKKKEAARIAWERVDERIIAESVEEYGKPVSDDSDDMDSDDSSAGYHRGLWHDVNKSKQRIVEEAEGVKLFIDALPYCVYLDQGFHYDGVSTTGDEICFCPCSKKLKNWRDNFELTDNEGCEAKKMSPLEIMAHLREKVEGETRNFRHLGAQWYLEELYKNYWGLIKPGIGHKGLYKQGDDNYKAALQAENIEKNLAMDYWRSSYLEQQRMSKEWEKEVEKLKAINEDLSEKAEQLKNNNVKLGIAAKRKKLKDYPSHEISAFKNQIHSCINLRKRLITKNSGELPFKTSQEISFQRLFDSWYEDPSTKNDIACLFGELDRKKQPLANAHKVVRNWDMQFDAGTVTSRKQDDGGPSRAFYNAFFEQVGDMVISFKVKNDTKNGGLMPAEEGFMVSCPEYGDGMVVEYNIKEDDDERVERENDKCSLPVKSSILFENEEELIVLERNMFTITQINMNLFDKLSSKGALIPLRDVAFENIHVKYLRKFTNIELTNVTEKARHYYRAIGRFIAHILFDDRNYTVSSLVLPSLLQNLFLRGIDPTSPLYKMEDLFPDLQQMDGNFTLVQDSKDLTFADWLIYDDMIEIFYKGKVSETDEITKDNFRIFADLYTLKSRNIAIEALNEGINFVRPCKNSKDTPNEEAMFPPMLANVPSTILSSVLFSCPKIDIEAIISVLRMIDYMYDIHQAKNLINILHELKPDKTLQFFGNILPSVLRRLAASDESFAANFLVYVTGSAFMPVLATHSDYKILVDWADDLNDDSIPSANTCVNQINFPKTCYDSKDEGVGEMILEERLKKMASICREAGYGLV